MAARFGDMLLEQRRRMGLSIQQVANTIKIRPQIIEFFETGNFASMPPRGYAQGMISSYARFLGLNPREVVNAYFDDIAKYKAYAGSEFADRHKQGAFTMIWISRFKPIQLKESAEADTTFLTINEAFAIYAGLMFLAPDVIKGMTEGFYNHLVYTLTYRTMEGRGLATLLYLMEKAALNGVKF